MAFLVIGLLLGSLLNRTDATPGKDAVGYVQKTQDILNIINQKYVDDVKEDELYVNMINDMLHELDPHSNYIPAQDVTAVNEQIDGEFGGIGIRFAIIRDSLCVTNVVKDSPSSRSGIKAGDKIVLINGKKISGKKLKNETVTKLLKGKPNTKVSIGILRGNKRMNFALMRGIIPIPAVTCAEMIDNQTGFIRLEQFSEDCSAEFHNAIVKLQGRGMKKLIFDLRDNPGGILQEAVVIVDEFLPAGMDIVEVKAKKSQNSVSRSTDKGLLHNTPTVVLINENSASASEIVAGALQDNDRATIIGRRSFGKGLVQQDFVLQDASTIRLTIARYYTPSGRCIQRSFKNGYKEYYHDEKDREKSGEYFAIDSSIFKNAPKYQTLKGRTVYGGGGIMPDMFVPLDTSNSTLYYLELRYSNAIPQFAFDYVSNKRTKWKSIQEFNSNFKPSDNEIEKLMSYASRELSLPINRKEAQKSKELIRTALKAEIARQLFIEDGYYLVIASADKEMQKALGILKGK